jgi:IS4 transposase
MLAARKTQSFTGHAIDALQNFADRLGFWPKLVFDRGFGNESLVTHLAAEGAVFYIRLKAGRFVEFDGQRVAVKGLGQRDSTIQLFGLTLRVIRTPKSRRHPEPWYILTNDLSSSRTKIAKIYYHRFEIEETFKDVKHIFELKRVQFDKPNSLKILLWFSAIGIGLLYITTRVTMHQEHCQNNKKRRSWIRIAWEQFQREITGYRRLTGLTPRLEVMEG